MDDIYTLALSRSWPSRSGSITDPPSTPLYMWTSNMGPFYPDFSGKWFSQRSNNYSGVVTTLYPLWITTLNPFLTRVWSWTDHANVYFYHHCLNGPIRLIYSKSTLVHRETYYQIGMAQRSEMALIYSTECRRHMVNKITEAAKPEVCDKFTCCDWTEKKVIRQAGRQEKRSMGIIKNIRIQLAAFSNGQILLVRMRFIFIFRTQKIREGLGVLFITTAEPPLLWCVAYCICMMYR